MPLQEFETEAGLPLFAVPLISYPAYWEQLPEETTVFFVATVKM
jgi:hypothetical protein